MMCGQVNVLYYAVTKCFFHAFILKKQIGINIFIIIYYLKQLYLISP